MRRFLSLLIFTRLQYPMGRHLIQLVYSDKVGTIYCLEKIKLHSHIKETFTVLISSCNVPCY